MSQAADDARLPADPEFRAALVGYLEWGTRLAMGELAAGGDASGTRPGPPWGWGVAPALHALGGHVRSAIGSPVACPEGSHSKPVDHAESLEPVRITFERMADRRPVETLVERGRRRRLPDARCRGGNGAPPRPRARTRGAAAGGARRDLGLRRGRGGVAQHAACLGPAATARRRAFRAAEEGAGGGHPGRGGAGRPRRQARERGTGAAGRAGASGHARRGGRGGGRADRGRTAVVGPGSRRQVGRGLVRADGVRPGRSRGRPPAGSGPRRRR